MADAAMRPTSSECVTALQQLIAVMQENSSKSEREGASNDAAFAPARNGSPLRLSDMAERRGSLGLLRKENTRDAAFAAGRQTTEPTHANGSELSREASNSAPSSHTSLHAPLLGRQYRASERNTEAVEADSYFSQGKPASFSQASSSRAASHETPSSQPKSIGTSGNPAKLPFFVDEWNNPSESVLEGSSKRSSTCADAQSGHEEPVPADPLLYPPATENVSDSFHTTPPS
jgi:hypothetical protein